MKKLVYVAAPLDPTKEEIEDFLAKNTAFDPFVGLENAVRRQNLARASRWVAWVAKGGDLPVATWITIASEWGESVLMLDVEIVYRCDELWLVGGRISEKMTIERRAAEFSSIRVRDLTRLGPEPPTDKPTAETIK